MKDLFKKGLLVGLGAAEATREALSKAVAELEKKGEVSRSEAKKLMDSISKSAGKRRKEIETTVEKTLSSLLGKMKIVSEQRVAKLEKRLAAVEKKLKAAKK